MYNHLVKYLIVSPLSLPDMMQINEKTGITAAIPEFLVKTTLRRYNVRIKLAKTLVMNMKVHQKHLDNVCTSTPSRLPQAPLRPISCTRTFMGHRFFESEVFIPFF